MPGEAQRPRTREERRPFLNVQRLLTMVKGVAGDFIEFGTFKGDTLVSLARVAQKQGRTCHGVDSFEGLPEPTDDDGALGRDNYWAGKFSVTGGVAAVRSRVDGEGVGEFVVLWPGFIPDVLGQVSAGPFAFAHVDLDLYEPTLAALDWVWPRMATGGVVACHDYIPSWSVMATGAVDRFLAGEGLKLWGRIHKTGWFRKD